MKVQFLGFNPGYATVCASVPHSAAATAEKLFSRQ